MVSVILISAKQYSLDVVGFSLTKCRGSKTVELGEAWKLFYSGVEPEKFSRLEWIYL